MVVLSADDRPFRVPSRIGDHRLEVLPKLQKRGAIKFEHDKSGKDRTVKLSAELLEIQRS